MIKGHGGNIYDLAEKLGCHPSKILDMSSNVNPLGPPPGLADHLRKQMSTIIALPEVDAGKAVAAFARRYGIDPECVLAGNGTTQFIYSMPLALEIRRALILGPTYSDYADACIMHQVPYAYLIAWETMAFNHDLRRVEKGLRMIDTVFVCNPNNPTGALIPGDDLEELCRAHPEINFVVDESYLPFVPDWQAHSMVGRDIENVIALNSMSKIFRVPGLRMGFLISSKKNIKKFQRYVLPWNVNSLAQSAITYLMDNSNEINEFTEKTRKYLDLEKQFFTKTTEQAGGMKVFPSTTPFYLIRLLKNRMAHDVWERLAEQGILIRDCTNFKGLIAQYIRISLKTRDQNKFLLKKLIQITES